MTASMNVEVHEKFLTMDSMEFIEYFNSQNFSWQVTDYNQSFYFGSLKSPINDERILKKSNVLLQYLPANFDAREKWPQCETIKQIYDQGSCGSCWAFGVASTASDRTCIHKNIHVHLSEEDFECMKYDVCSGGFPEEGFLYWYSEGLVTDKCKPYDVNQLKRNTCEQKCFDENMCYTEDKHYAETVYRLENDVNCIKSELVEYGPVEAIFVIFEDFLKYGGGIYEHTFGDVIGRHSVRVIGYGVENDKEYWLVANSWGELFGEKGYFKIKMKQEDVEFENYILSGLPKN